MSWVEVIDNPKHLQAFFDSFEGLESVSLFAVTLDREGSRLTFRADLARFPDRRSSRWHPRDNQAQVRISVWGVSALEIRGWATTIVGTLEMARRGPTEIDFAFRSDAVSIVGRCGIARLVDLTAYVNDPASGP